MKNQLSRFLFIAATILFTVQVCQAQLNKIQYNPPEIEAYSGTNYSGTQHIVNAADGVFQIPFNIRSIKIPSNYYVVKSGGAECLPSGSFCSYLRGNYPNVNLEKRCGLTVGKLTKGRDPKLLITVVTGGDDLRKGSTAVLNINYCNGTLLTATLNNGQQGWGNNATHTITYLLPAGTALEDISDFSIEYTSGKSGPFDGTDNWNVDKITIAFQSSTTSNKTMRHRIGTPLVRFSGNKTAFNF